MTDPGRNIDARGRYRLQGAAAEVTLVVKNPGDSTNAERMIRRHVIELLSTIHAAVAAGLPVGRTPPPDQSSLPSLDDHYRALGMQRPPELTARTHLRTRPAVQSVAVALCALINRGSFHGDDVAIRCGDREAAHRALLVAERAGWIVRGKFDLSIQQRALPSKHHLPGCEWLHEASRWSDPPIGHHWITETTQWIEASDVEEILREGAP